MGTYGWLSKGRQYEYLQEEKGEMSRRGRNDEEKVKLGKVGEVGVGLGLHGDWPMLGWGESFDLPCQNVPLQSSISGLGYTCPTAPGAPSRASLARLGQGKVGGRCQAPFPNCGSISGTP